MDKAVVVFEAARNGGVMAKLERRPAFPDRRWIQTHPIPKVGEWWDVSIAGENPAKTVWFLLPIGKIPPPVWEGRGEVIKTLPDGLVIVEMGTRKNVRNTYFGDVPEYSFGDAECTIPLSPRSGAHHFYVIRAMPGTSQAAERKQYESRIWDSIIAEKVGDVLALGKYLAARKLWGENMFGAPLPNLTEGDWEEIFWKERLVLPEDKKSKLIALVREQLDEWWAEVQATPRPMTIEEARRKAAELGGEYEERLWMHEMRPLWAQIARFPDGTWVSLI
jgi:hypothetical protein